MPEYLAVVTIRLTAGSKEHAETLLQARVMGPYQVERIVEPVPSRRPGDEAIQQLAYAYEALGTARPEWRSIPLDQAGLIAGQLIADYTEKHGPPGSAAEMAVFTRRWVRDRL